MAEQPTIHKPAWQIYEQSLRQLGHGTARWFPEPQPGSSQLRVGDVAYQDDDGQWHGILNVLEGMPLGELPLPDDFTRLDIHSGLWSRGVAISEGTWVVSEGLKAKEKTRNANV